MTTVTLADVQAAATAIAGSVVRTPSAVSHTLSDLLGCAVIVKFENFQFVASFKERGARTKLLSLSDAERARGVVAVSAGNHAQAVARHARLLGIDATIVMPQSTPYVKVGRTKALGARVELHGDSVAEAMTFGRALVERENRTLVHPFDDEHVIAGQGTVGLELFADHPDLDAVVVPVGGGGLLAGMSVVARANAPQVQLFGAQTEVYPSMARALAHDDRPVPGGPTMADGIAVAHAGALTSELLAAAGAEILTVGERSIEDAVNHFLEIEKVVAEGAGAAGLAAIIEHPERFAGKTVGVVLTGGNIDPRLLSSVILRGLVHDGRLSRLRVWLDDRPGSLSLLTAVVGEAGGNIVEVHHQRLFASAPIRSTEVELAIETMDREHADTLVRALEARGYRVSVVPMDTEPT
ncbi:MAG: threonine dehydratase [Actinomycetota bacterium]